MNMNINSKQIQGYKFLRQPLANEVEEQEFQRA